MGFPAARIFDPVTHDALVPSGMIVGEPPAESGFGPVLIEHLPAAHVDCIIMCNAKTIAGPAHAPLPPTLIPGSGGGAPAPGGSAGSGGDAGSSDSSSSAGDGNSPSSSQEETSQEPNDEKKPLELGPNEKKNGDPSVQRNKLCHRDPHQVGKRRSYLLSIHGANQGL